MIWVNICNNDGVVVLFQPVVHRQRQYQGLVGGSSSWVQEEEEKRKENAASATVGWTDPSFLHWLKWGLLKPPCLSLGDLFALEVGVIALNVFDSCDARFSKITPVEIQRIPGRCLALQDSRVLAASNTDCGNSRDVIKYKQRAAYACFLKMILWSHLHNALGSCTVLHLFQSISLILSEILVPTSTWNSYCLPTGGLQQFLSWKLYSNLKNAQQQIQKRRKSCTVTEVTDMIHWQ